MADIYAVKGESLTTIADAIREKTGGTDALGLSEMPGAIRSIQAVDDDGSYDEGYAAGRQTEYDAFWDAFQENGTRRNYDHAFLRSGWSDVAYNPKYPIIATNATSMYYQNNQITDTKVPIDFSGVSLNYTFNNAGRLKTIRKIISSDATVYNSTVFGACSALENLTIAGSIASNGFSVSQSPKLTHDSLMSIINALKDFSGTNETRSITLGTENLEKLADAEKMMAVNKGWTLVGWTPQTWEEGDNCPKCWGYKSIDENGWCENCGYSIPEEKRICSCGGDVGENCVCVSCGKLWHFSEGPTCVLCSADLLCPACGDWTGGNPCPSCMGC